MDTIVFLEMAMLVCFGFSWPANIVKAYRSRTAKGKSGLFSVIVLIGYICGVSGKFVAYAKTGHLAHSTWFYLLDMAMVIADILLFIRNVRLDRARDAANGSI